MSTIVIDPAKCKKDGLCVAECPYLLLREGNDGIPVLVDGAEGACIECGHCIVICPGNAITLNGITTNDCETVNHKQSVSKEQVTQLFRSRRSI